MAVIVAVGLLPGPATAGPTRPAGPARSEFVCARHPKAQVATCLAERRTDIPVRKRGELATSGGPAGFGPADLASAYNIPAAPVQTSPTVAIVDAYDDPMAEADLGVYRSQFGLPLCTTANGCFRKVSQSGRSTLPRANAGWSSEIALDLQMVSAACGACKILLVEASSASLSDLSIAENYAAGQVGTGGAVSNSYGASESSSDPRNSAYHHTGVAIVASSGDEGYTTEFPAASPYVIAVGGTSLARASNSRGWTESVWHTSDSEGPGSGCSRYETKPTWQHDSGCTRRTLVDVAAVADPATGVAVYDSYGSGGWTVFGGTSVAAPLVATMFAMSGSSTPTAQTLYTTPNGLGLNDVTTGTNSSTCASYLCQAGPGYDGPTGNGTPWGLAALGGPASSSSTAPFAVTATPAAVSAVAGTTAAPVTIGTSTVSGNAQTLTLSTTGVPATVTATLGATSLTSGTSTTLTLTTSAGSPPGSYPITVTATGADGTTTATTAVTLTVTGTCSAAQQLTNPGFESGSTGWTSSTGVVGQWPGTSAPHTGTWDAWMDGYNARHTDTLTQTVSVPAGCSTAHLSYWLHVLTNQTSTTTAYDTLKVALGGATVATYSNLSHSSGWVQYSVTYNLTPGQTTVPLTYTGVQSGTTTTSFLLDDTAMTFS